MKFFFIIPFLYSCFDSLAQDTIRVTKQKGFLFISAYNYLYDKTNHEIKVLGFHDFFFPLSSFNKQCLLDSNVSKTFKSGVRVSYFQGRNGIKNNKLTNLITCIDTTNCYRYDNFYVVPVEISYNIYKDNFPYVCDYPYYEVKVINGAALRFEYLPKAISILRIKVLTDK